MAGTSRVFRSDLLAMILSSPLDVDETRRCALRAALRQWRSALVPEHVGLPSRKRRSPGLSSAEVAELAGLSLCWYMQFERASPSHSCSSRAVDRIANALRLEDVDRAMLQILASRELFRSVRTLLERSDLQATSRLSRSSVASYSTSSA